MFSLHGVPWREKTAIKFATSLPNRIIDSIMAQGNWNILFQEGPFAEFQRQIAVANHLALRGEKRSAEQYFSRAETALEIAYGSLRGKFGWPRSAATVNANDLQWGENRDTFQDYLLCHLQLYLESGLILHENGELRFAEFESVLAGYQKQLGVPLQKKDAELDLFVRLIRDALAIRSAREQNRLVRADRFAAISDKIPNGGKAYWNHRTNLFRIFENLFHGNLGRAQFLVGLQRRGGADHDNLYLARTLIRCSDFTAARAVAESALASQENHGADNYGDYLRYSEILQNLSVWLGDKAGAGKTAAATVSHLESLLKADQIPREEIADVRNAMENQKLRAQKHAYLSRGECPSAAPDAAEHEMEWQVRERLFQENCGKPLDRAWWRALLASPETSAEIKLLAAQRLAGEKAANNFLEKSDKNENTTDLKQFFTARHRLQQALMRKTSNAIPELLVNYLRAANHLQPDLLFLDWGIKLSDNLSVLALDKIANKISEKQAAAVFAELHRRYALEILRGIPIGYFSPPDAAELMRRIVPPLLDTAARPEKAAASQQFARHDLWFADSRLHVHFNASKGRLVRFESAEALSAHWQKTPADRDTVLFGNIPAFPAKQNMRLVRIAPLFFYCGQCGTDQKFADRLVMPFTSGTNSAAIKAELSDTFSTAPDPQSFSACNAGDVIFRDTLFIDTGSMEIKTLPCDLRVERLVAAITATGNSLPVRLLLAMGWRKDLYTVVMPETLAGAERVSFLYDLFQRANRRQMRFTEAFSEAATRAEKSFPQGAPLQSLQIYGSFN